MNLASLSRAPSLQRVSLALLAAFALTAQAASPAAASHTTVASACNDFDDYVNGQWKASTDLPPDRSRVGSFDVLRMANDRLLESALVDLKAQPALQSSPGLKLLAAYYSSGMNTAAIEERGISALQPLLADINGLTRKNLPQVLGSLARLQIAAPLSIGVGTDAKDATRHVLSLRQSGLGLPDRDDYSKTDATTVRVTAAYRAHARTLLQAAGRKADEATLDALMAFETSLANAALTRVQQRDPTLTYNPVGIADLETQAPGLDWQVLISSYTSSAELPAVRMVLDQPAFAKALAGLAANAPLETWRDYLRVRLLDTVAQHGPKALADSYFAYHSGAQRGLKTQPPRSETVILAIGGRTGASPMGQTLGELYAAKAFSPLAQKRALQMVDDIRAGMRQRIAASPWMSKATQTVALEKLEAMTAKIGVPEKWKNYDGLVLQPDDYMGNLLRVSAWSTADRLKDLPRPVDRSRWNTSPHIVNAFAAGGNQIVFPAGILQPPFFDENADDATNYGAIGMVIGHEITHHFDDRGRQFDAVGNLRDWWQPSDAAAYRALADRVAALYSGFEPLPGERINGKQTLGENLSDLGGMQIAFAGLQIALERQKQAGKAAPQIDGRSPEQRFFMANAIVWRTKERPESIISQLRTGSHSPGRFRVLGPMSQMDSFARAFNCQPGDAMVAGEAIIVW